MDSLAPKSLKKYILIEYIKSNGESKKIKLSKQNCQTFGEIILWIEKNLNIPISKQWLVDPQSDLIDKFDDSTITFEDLPKSFLLKDIRDIPIKIEQIENSVEPLCGWEYIVAFFRKCIANNVFIKSDYFCNWMRRIMLDYQDEINDRILPESKLKKKLELSDPFVIYFHSPEKHYTNLNINSTIHHTENSEKSERKENIALPESKNMSLNNSKIKLFIKSYDGYFSQEDKWEYLKGQVEESFMRYNPSDIDNYSNIFHCKHLIQTDCVKCATREILRDIEIITETNNEIRATKNGYYCSLCNLHLSGKGKSKALNHIKKSKNHEINSKKICSDSQNCINELENKIDAILSFKSSEKEENSSNKLNDLNKLSDLNNNLNNFFEFFKQFPNLNSWKPSQLENISSQMKIKEGENLKQSKETFENFDLQYFYKNYKSTFGSSSKENETEIKLIFYWLENNKLKFNRESIEKYFKAIKFNCMATTINKLKKMINRYFLKPNHLPLLKIAKNTEAKPRQIISSESYLNILKKFKVKSKIFYLK